MSSVSSEEEFRRISQTSALELKCDRIALNTTFRSPDTQFEGLNMSSYFKAKSQPIEALGDGPACKMSRSVFGESFLTNSRNVQQSFNSLANASFASVSNEISVSDNTLAITEKLLRQKKGRKRASLLENVKMISFAPTANSTEMSLLPQFESFACPIVRETELKLSLPVFAEYFIEVFVENKTGVIFNLLYINSNFNNSVEVKQLKPCLIPPHQSGSIKTEISITALNAGNFEGALDLILEARDKENDSRKSNLRLDCIIDASEISITMKDSKTSNVFMNFFTGQEIITNFDVALSLSKFDMSVPLEFRLEDRHISFIPHSSSDSNDCGVGYRCPEKNLLKATFAKDSSLKIPLRIRPKFTINRFEMSLFLDSKKRNYLHSFLINVKIWPKSELKSACLGTPGKLMFTMQKPLPVTLRNKSKTVAIKVTFLEDETQNTSIIFSNNNFLMAPNSNCIVIICVKESKSASFALKVTHNGGYETKSYETIIPSIVANS